MGGITSREAHVLVLPSIALAGFKNVLLLCYSLTKLAYENSFRNHLRLWSAQRNLTA